MLWLFKMKWFLVVPVVVVFFNDASLALRMLAMTGGGAVRSGGSVTLRCSYDLEGAQLYSIRWYRNEMEFYRYVPKESPPALVFSLPGVHVDLSASNDQQISLTGMHRQLTGLYHCEVSADAPSFHTEIQSTRLEIVDIPESAPQLSVDRQRFSPGDSIRANCSSSASYPGANITWYLNGEMIFQTHTTTLPHDPDLWEACSSFSIIEITTEEELQHPKYQVGGSQQEISSSQLRIPSQNPEVTVYTAYSSFQNNQNDRKNFETNPFPGRYKYNEVKNEELVYRDDTKDESKQLDQAFRDYPLKVTRVRLQPGFGGVLKLKCEASIYDVYKLSSDVVNIREETPHIALVMGQSSTGMRNNSLGSIINSFLFVGIRYLSTVWKLLLETR